MRDGFTRDGGGGGGCAARQAASPAVAPAASLSELENPSQTPALPGRWTFLGAGVARRLPPGLPGPIPRAARLAASGLNAHTGLRLGVWSFPQNKMCLWKLTVGVTTAGRGGARPLITLPREAQAEQVGGGLSDRGSLGAGPVLGSCLLCTFSGLDHSPLAKAWRNEALPSGYGDGEQSSPSTFLPAWGNWVGTVYCPPGCILNLHPPSSWHLGQGTCCAFGQALTETQVTPLHALNLQPAPEEGVKNLFPFPASLLLCQGSK